MQPLGENTLNVPAFLSKLWKMVNDPKTDHLIAWGSSGTTFVIQNQAQFWYELLPLYYKHNNMSSFIRQLNMYGFHKISSYDVGLEVDKDELQFFHEYFVKDNPELMKHIKRKVTSSHRNPEQPSGSVEKGNVEVNREELSKFLSEVTQLKSRQQNVDSQLVSMKQENAVLWRELALLRQKHHQQQKIVNKLIQFLVTLVQPPPRMGGLNNNKRHFPLMIDEKPPSKKPKTSSKGKASPSKSEADGPIIHELELQDELLNEATNAENRDIVDEFLSNSDLEEVLVEEPRSADPQPLEPVSITVDEDGKVFLTDDSQNMLLSNLMNGNYNIKPVPGTSGTSTPSKTVATRDNNKVRLSRLNSIEDMDLHVDNTQSELDSLKDILNPLLGSVNSVDANAFLNLFNDESPPYGLSYNPDDMPKSDPMVSGSELTKYAPNLDFSQLFDEESNDELPTVEAITETLDETGSITTPQLKADAPTFPRK